MLCRDLVDSLEEVQLILEAKTGSFVSLDEAVNPFDRTVGIRAGDSGENIDFVSLKRRDRHVHCLTVWLVST